MQPTTAPAPDPATMAAAVAAALEVLSTATTAPAPEPAPFDADNAGRLAADLDRLANDLTTAARRTGLSRTTLYRLMDSGELRFVKIGARRLIPEDALRDLLAGRGMAAA
jgi:excisionase family DNA binding protein